MGEIQIKRLKTNIWILCLNLIYKKGKMVKGNVRVFDVYC